MHQSVRQEFARLALAGGIVGSLNYLIGPAAAMGIAEHQGPLWVWEGGLLAAGVFGQERLLPLLRVWQLYRHLGLHHFVRRLMKFTPPGAHRLLEGVKAEIALLNRNRLTPEKELTAFYRAALQQLMEKRGAAAIGDYLEFGVYNGTSLICMYRALTQLGLDHVRLFGFDSFEGLPPDDEGHWGPGGRFKSELEFTRKVLAREGVPLERVVLVKGFFCDSLTPALIAQHQLHKASVVMVDCDMYQSTREALQFCGPLLAEEALLVFDDWHPLAAKNMGEKRAFDEFLQTHPSVHPRPHDSTYAEQATAFWVTRSPGEAAEEKA